MSVALSSITKLRMESTQSENRQIDSYGFQLSKDSKTYNELMAPYLQVMAHRTSRWKEIMGRNRVPTKSRQLKRFCRKGIPPEYRTELWMELSGAADRMRERPDLYKHLLTDGVLNPTVMECIEKDIPRTFPENVHFDDTELNPNGQQQPLQRVLSAIAKHNPRLGYCQGMNFVAGLMLLVMKNEEKVFWLYDTLINNVIPDFYCPDMTAVKVEQLLLGEIVRWKLPAVYAHMEALGVLWCLVGMKWFICMFADVLPTETVFRIWDCMVFEGSKILLRVAFTLISMNKDAILACRSFTEVVNLFRSMVSSHQVLNCHSFMQNIFTLTGSFPRKQLNKMRAECLSKIE
ncbi:growth hormone-regulated TBC protein 1-like [Gigantopelta aegis]|uniref:growth hormone-regulated TBC protein 1-like n=1 Tax=Gigantopelta aegis TaxID=1735272 RepID=UPI001B8873C2|nr:growth hormone-regulated TBC protein 1-like [Gigantopelta aegis]